jgi:hypothetical protein
MSPSAHSDGSPGAVRGPASVTSTGVPKTVVVLMSDSVPAALA